MKQQEVQTQPSPSRNPSPRSCASGACPLTSRWGLLLWALVIGGIAYMQWPMLKGMLYKTTKAEAPASTVAWGTWFG